MVSLDELRKQAKREERLAAEARERATLTKKIKTLQLQRKNPKLTRVARGTAKVGSKTLNVLDRIGGAVVRGGVALGKTMAENDRKMAAQRAAAQRGSKKSPRKSTAQDASAFIGID